MYKLETKKSAKTPISKKDIFLSSFSVFFFSMYTRSTFTVSAHKEYSGGFDWVIEKKECWWLSAHIQHLAMLASIYSSTYTRMPVPYIYIQKTPCTLYTKDKSRYIIGRNKRVIFPVKSENVWRLNIYANRVIYAEINL